jgi:hypothetical protein
MPIAAFQPLITDHLVLLWLSREEWTPRCELGPPGTVDELIRRGYAKLSHHGRFGKTDEDGISLTELGWQEVARIQERLR